MTDLTPTPEQPRTAEYGDGPLTDVLIEMRQFLRTVNSYPATHEIRSRAPGWVSMIDEWEQRLRAAIEARPEQDEAVRLLEWARSTVLDLIETAPVVARSKLFNAARSSGFDLDRRIRRFLKESEAATPPPAAPPALDVSAMTETLRFLYHADEPCDAPDKHRHEWIAMGIVGQYPRFARRLSPDQEEASDG